MVMSGQVLESWVACLRSFSAVMQDIGGFVAIGIGHHGASVSLERRGVCVASSEA